MDMEIYRGDVFYVVKGNEVGNEQQGGRPAVIVSNDIANKHSGNVTVVFLTTKPKADLPTHTMVTTTREMSTALCENVTTVSKERIGNYLCSLKDEEMYRIDDCLREALHLGEPLPFTPDAEEFKAQPLGSILPPTSPDVELVRLQTERDLYKELYMRHTGLM